MPRKWISHIVFLILWPTSLIGLLMYFKDELISGLIVSLASYLFFGIYHFFIYRHLNIQLNNHQISLVRPNHSNRVRFENLASIPFFVSILFVATLTSKDYGLIGFLVLPTIFYLILWLTSIMHYNMWYGIITTNKKIITEKDSFLFESIDKISLKEGVELILGHKYKLDDIVLDLKNFRTDELSIFFKELKNKTQLTIQILE